MIAYAEKELAKYLPASPELMAQYRDGSHTEKDNNGNLWWFQNDQVHRDGDKPAFIGANGSLSWYLNGQLHRDGDKPARIYADDSLVWWQNDQIHRICGPAIIRVDGRFDWGINGENITQEVYEWLNGEEWLGTSEQIVEFKLRFA